MFTRLSDKPLTYSPLWERQPLESRLQRLRRGKQRVAWVYEKPDTSTFRYRCLNPSETLAEVRPDIGASWFEIQDLPALLSEMPNLTAIVLCRVRYDAQVAKLITRARTFNVRLIFDCDDLVFDIRYAHLLLQTLDLDTQSADNWNAWFALIGRIEATARLCDAGVTTNDFLSERLGKIVRSGKVGIIPNYLDREQQDVSQRLLKAKKRQGFQGNGLVTIGYFSGSPSHNRDFAIVEPALAKLLAGDTKINLRIVGFLELSGPLQKFLDRIEFVPLQDYINLQLMIAEVDINLSPLQDNAFTNCKSELKFFEAAAVGTWTIASPTFAFKKAIEDGVTGRLCHPQQWADALAEAVRLVRDHKRYAQVAQVAAADVYQKYGWNRRCEDILKAVSLS